MISRMSRLGTRMPLSCLIAACVAVSGCSSSSTNDKQLSSNDGDSAARPEVSQMHTGDDSPDKPIRKAKPSQSVSRRPNILWIIAENIGPDLGCYGARYAQTPNLDRLAAEGVRYTRVFATSPSCAPSRSAFMTGMYQTTTDTHHMRSHRDDDFRLPPSVGCATPVISPPTSRSSTAGSWVPVNSTSTSLMKAPSSTQTIGPCSNRNSRFTHRSISLK